jgi:hypothetical protein
VNSRIVMSIEAQKGSPLLSSSGGKRSLFSSNGEDAAELGLEPLIAISLL